jgi:hypothetical protein
MFPYHGHPLSWYDFSESIHPKNHDIEVAAIKKVDAELKQAMLAATSKCDKKQKCVELEKVERAKAMTMCEYHDQSNYLRSASSFGRLLGGESG